MKKIFAILSALLIAATMVACSEEKETKPAEKNEGDAVSIVYENVDLVLVADSLYDGIAEDERPFVMSMPLTEEDFEYFTFIPYEEGLEAVANEPMMGSIAHSVVLVKCPTVEKAAEVAEAMKANCNPRKWICVEADVVEATTNGNIAMLLMTTSEGGMSETILGNFKALDAEKIAALEAEAPEEVVDEEIVDDEPVLDENGEVVTEEEDVVIEVPEVEVDETPAEVTEEENVPAVMPEVTPEVETPVVEPEVEVEIDTPAVMPEVTPEVETPAVEPEEVPVEDETPVEPEEAPATGNIDELYALCEKLYTGINPEEMPMVGTMELNEENFEYSAFIPYKSSYLAVENMPMMGSMPHSVVIVKTASPAEAAQVAADMKANANPRKWICVSARSVKSASKGNFAILVMTSVEVMPDYETIDEEAAEEMSAAQSDARAQLIIDNFLANA